MNRILLLSLFAAGAAFAQQKLECNTPVTANLTRPTITTPDVFNVNGPTQVSQFDGLAGENVLLRIYFINPDKDFHPQMLLRGPAAAIIPSRTTYAANGASMAAEYTLTDTGVHSLEMRSTNDMPSGTYRILLLRLSRPCPNAVLTCGAPVSTRIDGLADTRVYTFNAAASDVVSFRFIKTGPLTPISSNGGPPTPPPATNVALLVYGPDGILMNTLADDKVPAALQQNGRDRLQVDVKTTRDGPLTAIVFDQNNVSAEFTVSASRLNGACGDKILNCGSVVDASIDKPIETDGYVVTAAAGDVFQVRLARKDTTGQFLPFGEIYDPAGKLLSNIGAVTTSSHAQAVQTFRATVAGRYTILTEDGADGTQKGGYTIALNRLNRPCPNGPGLGCGSVVDAAVDGLLRQNSYSFTAAAGDSFLFRLLRTGSNTNFRPRVDIYDPTGNVVQTTNTTDLTRVNFTVADPGDYTVVVSDAADGSQSGSYTLSALRLNRPCNATGLECGKVAAGSIDGALRYSSYSYTAAAGESFSLRLLNPSGGLQPDLEVYDAGGQRVGTDVTGNVRGVDVTKPAGGQYTVVALDSSKTPGRGAFALQLLRTKNACGIALPQGQSTTGVVSGTAPFASYSFPVNAGDLLMVRSTSFTPGFNALMEIYDADGVRVDGATFSVTRRVTAPGSYTAMVSASNPKTAGSFVLSWQLLNNPANASPLQCGSTLGGAVTPATPFRYYSAGLSNNDIAKVLLTPVSSGFSPQVELYDPAGTRLASTASEIQQKVRADGNYLVVVSPSSASGDTGTYSLALQRPNNPCNPVSLKCGQSVLRQADTPGQIDALTFNGNAGDLTTLKFGVRSGSYAPFAELFDSTGTLVRSNATGSFNLALPANGPYTLLVRDRNGTGTGSYRASLQTDPACTVDDKEAPVITLLTPTGGEVAAGGSAFHIAWQSDDNVDVAAHEVRLSTDGGKTFPTVLASVSGAAQSVDWTVPSDVTPTRTAAIRVTATDAAGNATSATSDLLTVIGSGFTENTKVSLTYDPMNRVTSANYGDGRTVSYTYDASGNLVQITVSGQ